MAEANRLDYFADSGLLILIGAATVEQTGFKPGQLYEFVATDPCLCRWGAADAAIADAGFDFAVPAGAAIRAFCPAGDTALNVIEASSASAGSATLLVSRVKTH